MSKHIQQVSKSEVQDTSARRGPIISHGLEIGFVLDASGSMEDVADHAVRGFNALVTEQKKITGSAQLSLTLFSNDLRLLYDGVPIAEIGALDQELYRPSGGTALYDGIGSMIDQIAARTDSTSKVIIAIMTDGAENCSKKYNAEQVAQKIFERRITYDWQFLFLSAAQNALDTGLSLRIAKSNIVDFTASSDGLTKIMHSLNAGLRAYRLGDRRYMLKFRND